jgi:mono/diheme cytochrome c family protein
MGGKCTGKRWAMAVTLVSLIAGTAFGQTKVSEQPSGRDIFRATCVACHGTDSRGAADATRGFERPPTFPDFTVCNATTREPNRDWSAILHNGGPARGFSEIMPSFREALTSDQIEKVVEYLRGFCREPSWPRGELNLPRALFTEKAFPEDEAVIDAAIDTKSPRNVTSQLTYERRFGIRNQIEVKVPFTLQASGTGSRFGGVGDMAFGFKRVLASSLRTGSIFSLAGEAVLPTGNTARGMGKGVTILESFASFGQLLPKDSFFQMQGGVEVPTHTGDANKAVYWRTAVGKSFAEDQGHGRLWTPMVELLADRELAPGESINWDVVPQFQVTLSRRQHIRADFGVRLPANNTAGRSPAIMFYLLWDWFDGGLRDGWK